MVGLFPFTSMFLVTSIAMLRERTTGTLERLMSLPLAKLDLLLGYGIAFAPALNSRHTEGRAIDMSVKWSGVLAVKNKDGSVVNISSTPRNGFNLALRKVGKSYSVTKHPTDPPHWSTDGK